MWRATASAAAGSPTRPPGAEDIGDALGRLQTLVDRGLITREDFERKKAELLDRHF